MTVGESRQGRADRLAPVALEWVQRLREGDVDALAREMLDHLPRADLYALIGLLGGAVDPTAHPDVLWGWVRHRRALDRAAAIESMPADEDPEVEVLERIRRLAAELGLSDREIADRVGMSETAVTRRRQRAETPTAHPRAPRRGKTAVAA